MNLDLVNFKNDVSNFYEKLEKETSIENFEIFHKVFLSPYYNDTKILFIGINPGDGEKINCVDEIEEFEYLKYDFNLARETKKVFEIANKSHLLYENVVKTNFYYLITKSEKEIYQFTNNLPKDLRDEFFLNSYKWTNWIVKLTNPKIIICEGKTAYENVYDSLNLEFNNERKLDGVYVTTFINSKIILIGYSRRFSNIKNKEKLAEILNEFL